MTALRDLVRRLGALDAALFLADRALDRVTRGRARVVKYYFMAQPVPSVASEVRSGGIVVEELNAGDPRLVLLDRSRRELERRFSARARCISAWQGDTLAGFLWFTEQPYAEEEVRCVFRVRAADRAVWDLDVHVVPRFRLGRTFALLWDAAFAAMRERGVRWTISRVSAFKSDSIRAHQRLGAQRTGWAVFVLLGSYQLTLSSLGRLKCGRHEHGAYPEIEVRPPSSGDGEANANGVDEPLLVDGREDQARRRAL